MKTSFQGFFVGCLIYLLLFPIVYVLYLLFDYEGFFGFFFLSMPLGFVYGIRLVAKIVGPQTGLWLMTDTVGVSFAYLSIELFRQDKKISKAEMEGLCQYFAKEFGKGLYGITKAFMIKYKAKKADLKKHTQPIAGMEHRYRVMFLYQLFAMAMVDGKYKKEEDIYLQNIARLIRISKQNFLIIRSNFVNEADFNANEAKNETNRKNNKRSSTNGSKGFSGKFFSNENSAAYLSLGLNQFATNEEVKKAYRRLAMKYHPDRLNGKSAALKKEANQCFREVTEAYELIKNERGIK